MLAHQSSIKEQLVLKELAKGSRLIYYY